MRLPAQGQETGVRRATIKAHPSAPHPARPYGHNWHAPKNLPLTATRRPLTRARAEVGLSVAQNGQVDLAEARGVGDHVDLDDLPAPDREAQDRKQLST